MNARKLPDDVIAVYICEYLDVPELAMMETLNKFYSLRVKNMWEALYKRLYKFEKLFPLFWKPRDGSNDWKWRFKARYILRRETAELSANNRRGASKGIDQRIAAVLTGRFFPVNNNYEPGLSDDEENFCIKEHEPTTMSDAHFEEDVVNFRELIATREGCPYVDIGEIDFVCFDPVDESCRFNAQIAGYRTYGYGRRDTGFVWWTSTGEVYADAKRMKFVSVAECSTWYFSHPLKDDWAIVDSRMTSDKMYHLDDREFWTIFFIYGYFGSTGCDKFDIALNAIQPSVQIKGELSSCDHCGVRSNLLMNCSKCKNRMLCSIKCQKADWKTHKHICVASCK